MSPEDMLLFAMVSKFFAGGEKYPHYRGWYQRMSFFIRSRYRFLRLITVFLCICLLAIVFRHNKRHYHQGMCKLNVHFVFNNVN